MEIEAHTYKRLINALAGGAMLALAVGFAWAAVRFDVPYLHFFAGWFCRSAWVRVSVATNDDEAVDMDHV